ncbi:MAG: Lrp/AsnC ligand binding domain-containing protein [Candidatus Bathyarchaeota archaeon]|nr:Lrp/AsnC ligand binding domain-containing protein [Candidatus Bathyarchaeota archaeon]
METGYILINLKPGQKKPFLQNIKKINGVTEARLVLGNWDAIAKIQAENIQELEKIYLNEIDKIPNITQARLHIVACPRTRK